MRVVRVYHSGRDRAHRERDRALVRAGVDLTLVVPDRWPDGGCEATLSDEDFDVVELPARRPGDVHRWSFRSSEQLRAVLADRSPDVVDVHEEPVSSATHQVLSVLREGQPVVGYMAQNLDKRYPPPFTWWERRAFTRLDGLYPCSRQAASVAVGKGYTGPVRVLPLAPPGAITPGEQRSDDDELRLLLVGRLNPEKGVLDAVEVLAATRRHHPASLVLAGAGPEAEPARARAAELGVADALEVLPWLSPDDLAKQYRGAHVVLTPSRSTATWVEQFGRMVVEAQAAGAVVVGYGSGSLPEVVGPAGVLVEEGDVAGLGRAVVELWSSPQRWERLRDAGLAAARLGSWDAVAEGQLGLYRTAMARCGVRPVRPGPPRAEALRRFGGPARTPAGLRPFALPVVRDSRRATRALGAVIDLGGGRRR